MVETRTEKSVRNAKVALIFYLVQILLGFFSRKAFFDYFCLLYTSDAADE